MENKFLSALFIYKKLIYLQKRKENGDYYEEQQISRNMVLWQ